MSTHPTTATVFAPGAMSAWSEKLTCYTAALGVWLAHRQSDWWRPLLAGGPYLRVRNAGNLWHFDHSPEPWARALGLAARGCDDADEAQAAVATLRAEGPVIIAGDVFRLPWQQGYRRRHAPHWFVMPATGAVSELLDPLAMTDDLGCQGPFRGPVPGAPFAEWTRALPGGNAVHEARERSVIGPGPTYLGYRYRWLEPITPCACEGEPAQDAPGAGDRLEGSDACHALADHFAEHGDNPETYAQVADIWQVMRQRELAVAAAAVDPHLMTQGALAHWRAGLEHWRRVPGLLLHARLSASAQRPQPARAVVRALRAAAAFEGRYRLGEPEPVASADEWELR